MIIIKKRKHNITYNRDQKLSAVPSYSSIYYYLFPLGLQKNDP